jgi:HAD superfamily hydrolase (TIGR01484 family)
MKKIIFCDIDGTLAKRMHGISNKNIRAIKKYSDAGGEFVLTTGRSIVSTQKFQNQISEALQKEPNFIICSNGGYVINNVQKKIEIKTINEDLCRKIFSLVKEAGVLALFYTEEANDKNGVYATDI